MTAQKKTSAKRLTNEKMLHILLQEIADVRYELKTDIQNLDQRLSGRIDGLASDVTIIKTDLTSLRLEVHQNHLTFIKNHDDLEKRVTVLEAKCAERFLTSIHPTS
ncbi:MAG TPA: hypothetical protein VHA78_03305 [Candidatus Peribacteraceae bacterium]|nr:hypothetical protein [Candidatus Peribacteraceae bacterium]